MHRLSYWPYLILALFFFCVFSLPKEATERFRSFAVCSFSPLWRTFHNAKEKTLHLLTLPSFAPHSVPYEQLENAQRENRLLQSQLEQVRQWLLSEERIHEQYEQFKQLHTAASSEGALKDFFKRRAQELSHRLELQLQSLPAQVIFREPSSWSSALWIDVGEQHNVQVGKKIVAKNSPVLFGTSIIGVVEYVGQKRSRIRLITDAQLVPSVRAVRGNERNRFLLEQLDALYFAIKRRPDIFSSSEEEASVLALLSQLASKLNLQREDVYLAKGEIFGSSAPLWRSRSHLLKGIGFNYDFADEEGPARDLRSGEPYHGGKKEAVALLREGDILVTTGLDGIFPAGYRVAMVAKVHTLKEGACSYEIEAAATAGNLDEISHVVVLPPLEG